jgi:RNA polymerase sigma-70 factor (ECF subfamily)
MDDSEVVSEFIRTGEHRLFEILVRRHQTRVFRLALSILGPGREPEAEEVAQEVFLRAFRQIRAFRMESRFYTWLYRMTYNITLDRLKRARLRFPHLSDQILFTTPDPVARPSGTEERDAVRRCMEELPDLYRCVLYLDYWLGYSVEEIGELLGAPANTVKSYLRRARRRLHEILNEKGLVDGHGLL